MQLIFVRESRNKVRFVILLLLVLLFCCNAAWLSAQEKTVTYYTDPAGTPPDLPIRIKHLTARVSFIPEQHKVIGTAEFTYTPNRYNIDSIVFNTPDFNISEVLIDKQNVKFVQSGSNLVIFPESSLLTTHYSPLTSLHSLLTITYTATPLSGQIYFVGWQPEEAGKRKQIWAHRPNGWIPYMDGRITVDMFITFDGTYKVFSNGERLSVTDHPNGTKTWHYAMKKDHPFFSTALVIGDYAYTIGKTNSGIPLEFWYYPDMPDRVGTTYMYTERMFDFLEQELGFAYPYPLYRQAPVSDYMYGAMETTTSTIFGDYMQISPRSWWQRNYVNVNVHELAHQWFGNCVVHFVNRDVWLTESFATFYAKMFEKSIFGDDYFQNIRNDEMRLAFDAARKNDYPVGGSQGGVQRIYQKGSLVLEMLQEVMGEEEFRDAIHLYLTRYAFGRAETNDLVRCVYDATGKSYAWFFDQWVLRGGEPEYLIRDSVVTTSGGSKSTLFKVWQVQSVTELTGLFRMPLNFEVHYTDGSCDEVTRWIENKYTEVIVPNPGNKEVEYLLFDPNRKILKKWTFLQSPERLLAQAQHANHMIDRYDAWVALQKEPFDRKSEVLRKAFHTETFWLIRSEILRQLAGDRSPETVELFRQALRDPDANVRKTALILLNPVPDLLQSSVESLLYDSSYLNVEYALEALCVSFPKNTDYYLELTRDMEGWRGKNIRIIWLAIALSNGQTEHLPELIGYCSPKYEFETRINAFSLLKELGYYDEETQRYAEMGAKHWNNKLSGAAREYLKGSEVAK